MMDNSSSLKHRTAKGFFWGGFGSALQQLAGFLFGIILLRILSPEEYGIVGVLAIFTGIAGCIVEGGFINALINRNGFNRNDYNSVFWVSTSVGIVIYLILYFLSPLIAEFYESPQLVPLSRVVFLGFIFSALGVSHTAKLIKELRIKERVLSDLIAIICSGTAAIVIALAGYSYWGIAFQGVVFLMVGNLIRIYFAKWRPALRFDWKPIKEMFGFGSNLLVTSMLWQLNNNLYSSLLAKVFGYEQGGFYTQANKWTNMGVTTINGMIHNVSQSVFAEVIDNREQLIRVFRKMLRAGALVSFPLMLGLAFIADEFILIVAGNKWLGAASILKILCLWGASQFIWNLYAYLLIAKGRSDLYLRIMVGVCIAQIAIALTLYPFGITLMMCFYISVLYIALLFFHYYAYQLIGISWKEILKDIFPYLILTLGAFTVPWIISLFIHSPYLAVAIKITLSVTAYMLFAWLGNSVIFREIVAFIRKREVNNRNID
ncbi:MAG: lipopolysaccharide biosynthesis protein [Bacteroidales bacterium]